MAPSQPNAFGPAMNAPGQSQGKQYDAPAQQQVGNQQNQAIHNHQQGAAQQTSK
jgi:hypothetical protein